MERFILTASQKSAAGIVVVTTTKAQTEGAASSRRDSMGGKRQKNQLQMALAFTDEGRSEAPRARREGTETSTAKRACESPVSSEQVMEEVAAERTCCGR